MSQDTEPDKAGSHGEKTHDSNEGHVSNNADQPATDADQRDSDSTLRTRVTALILSGCALIAVGVFLTWTSGEGITLNGTQGAQNGWLVLPYVVLAASVIMPLRRWSAPAIASVLLASVMAIVVVVWNQSVPGFDREYGYWLTLVGAALLVAACVLAIAQRVRLQQSLRFGIRGIIGGLLVGLAAFLAVVLVQVLWIEEDVSWPPPPDAITADQAADAVVEFADTDPLPSDVGLAYAQSTADTVEPLAEGSVFYPRIFADVEAAESSVHILMYGWKPGDIAGGLSDVLVDKLEDGVEVRVLVDKVGSDPYSDSEEMFKRLAKAGAEIVVNDTTPLDRTGLFPDREIAWGQHEIGRADHRKLYVIDGEVIWTGGAGIEDHFEDGRFYDVMARMTGDIVRQAQAVFLTSFVSHGGALPDPIEDHFPEPANGGDTPATIVQVVPGGFVSATQSTREMIDGATERLDIMNPYFTDRDMFERVIGAAERGVTVRVVVSEKSNNELVEAATRHRYQDLIDAGVEIWEYPGAVVHAKIVVADDLVQVGTLNLDAWALYRNYEFAIMIDSADTASELEQRVFEPTISNSSAGEPPEGSDRARSWLSDKLAYIH